MKSRLTMFILFVAIAASSFAQNRALFKDPLLRKEVDPYAKFSGAPSQPLDEKMEALRYPDSNPPWQDFFKQYGSREMIYLQDWDKQVVLPNFPANTSKRTRAELDYLLDLQSKRSNQHLIDIKREVGNGLDSLGWLLDEHFDLAKMPATSRLLANSMQDVLAIHLTLKRKYLRARPSALDPRIKTCIEVPPYPAYPSGHSTQMHVLAYIFKELKPEGGNDFEREAFRVAWDREMAGLHYPSDTAAGQLLAHKLMERLMVNKTFLADLVEAKKEWADIKMKP